MDFRIKYDVRAQKFGYNAYSHGGSNWTYLAVPSDLTLGSNAVVSNSSQTGGSATMEPEYKFIIPKSFDNAVIDGDMFVAAQVELRGYTGSHTHTQTLTHIYANLYKVDSSGIETSLLEDPDGVDILGGTTYSENDTTIVKKIFGWVPIQDQLIKPDERLAFSIKLTGSGDSFTWLKLDHTKDTDDTYATIPFV